MTPPPHETTVAVLGPPLLCVAHGGLIVMLTCCLAVSGLIAMLTHWVCSPHPHATHPAPTPTLTANSRVQVSISRLLHEEQSWSNHLLFGSRWHQMVPHMRAWIAHGSLELMDTQGDMSTLCLMALSTGEA